MLYGGGGSRVLLRFQSHWLLSIILTFPLFFISPLPVALSTGRRLRLLGLANSTANVACLYFSVLKDMEIDHFVHAFSLFFVWGVICWVVETDELFRFY